MGYSNDIRFDGDRVIRSPPSGPPLFPAYDLEMQVAVQELAHAHGVPVPWPTSVVDGALVMPRVRGREVGDAPGACDWLLAATTADQRALHEGFVDVLAGIHRLPTDSLAGVLRGPGLDRELDWWESYAEWACEWAAPDALVELFRWCRAYQPAAEPPPSVLWGDVRLGNVVFGDDLRPAAVLDWEMATLGPAESDVAWFTALSELTDRFAGTVPGFLTKAEVVARHEAVIGRPLVDLAWHEAFALARSAACLVRTQIAAALAAGAPLPDPASNPVVQHLHRSLSD